MHRISSVVDWTLVNATAPYFLSFVKKFCLRANYLALFKRTLIPISTKKELQINKSKIACCLITLFASCCELLTGEALPVGRRRFTRRGGTRALFIFRNFLVAVT